MLRQRFQRAEKGQSLVELAIGMVILVMLISGLLDLGRIYYIYVALEDAVGEAALYLSINPYCEESSDVGPPPGNSATLCKDPNNATWRAKNAVGADVINWDRASLNIIFQTDDESVYRNVGEQVIVEITYPIDLLTPIVPRFTGVNPINMTTRASQTIISQP